VASLRTRESSLARTELSSARGGQFHLPPAKQPTDRAYGVRRRRAARPASTHSLTRPPTISTASVTATPGTSRSSASGANSTHQAPAGNRSKPRSPQGEPRLTAAARARQRQQPRVLQHPLSSVSSRSRPTKLDSATGRLCGRSTPGNGVTVPAPTSNRSACDMPASTSHSKPESGQATGLKQILASVTARRHTRFGPPSLGARASVRHLEAQTLHRHKQQAYAGTRLGAFASAGIVETEHW
jgi:hypothetical protein